MALSLFFARVRQIAPLALMLFSAAVAVAAYLQAINYPFVYDDIIYVAENTKLMALHSSELWQLFTQPFNDFSEFLPLRDFSYWFDLTMFGVSPTAFHAHNIILYILYLPLVYAVTLELWRYFCPIDTASASWAAAVVTALVALHPALVESVVWISGRKYVLSNLFAMLALWLAVRARRERHLSIVYAIGALVAFVTVMLSKTSYVAVAPVIALLWLIFWLETPKSARHNSQLLWPLAILLLTGCIAMVFVITGKGYIDVSGGVAPVFDIDAIGRSLAVLGWLTRLAISPESRHFLYPVFNDPHLTSMIAFGGVVLIAVVVGLVMLLRRRSLEGFALVVFFLLCTPYLQLIPYAPPSLVQDRFLALAMWPIMLLIVALLWRLKFIFRITVLLVIASFFVFQTIERPRDWRNFEVLIDADLRDSPEYYMPAYYKITTFQLPREQYREARNTANNIAIPEFRDVMLKLIDADESVYAASANSLQELIGLLGEVGRELKQPPAYAKWDLPLKNLWEMSQISLDKKWDVLIKRFPDNALIRYSHGLWLLSIPKYELAAEEFHTVIDSNQLPTAERGAAFNNFGFALMNSGHLVEAEDSLRAALEQTPPDLRAYCPLAEVYRRTGKVKNAARAQALCHQ